MTAIQSAFSKLFDLTRIVSRPFTHAQLLNRYQSFLVPVLDYSRTSAPVPLGKGNGGFENWIAPWRSHHRTHARNHNIRQLWTAVLALVGLICMATPRGWSNVCPPCF